jgi:lipid-A-disaccharide synthase-like uncharacterized protein
MIWWTVLGFTGQFFFGSRFFVQWIASERAKQSVIPTAFWYLSIIGTLLLLAYSIHRLDPVFIVGQSANVFIYIRNIMLIKKTEKNNDPEINKKNNC